MTSPTEQRRAFDAAMDSYRCGDTVTALDTFTRITADNPGMSDAWLGRLACGDHSLDTLAAAHEHSRALYRETRRLGLKDGDLYAQTAAPVFLRLPVWSRASIGLAYVSALISAGRYPEAADVLGEEVITGDTQAAQWHQFITAALYHRTRRWPDVLSATAVSPPAHATHVLDAVSAAVGALSAAAAASLGRFQAALQLTDRVATSNPYVAADVALTRGWCLRELGDEEAAAAAFRAAAVDGQLLEAARQALDNPGYRLIVTDAETIATRTDEWDPGTETSRAQRDAAALAAEQQQVLATAQARLDELIGLEGPKEQIAVWRTEIQIDQLLAEQGQGTSTANENHMVLEGPPGHRQDHLRPHRRRNPVRAGQDRAARGHGGHRGGPRRRVCLADRATHEGRVRAGPGRGAVHRRGLPAGARDRGPQLRQGRHQHAAEVHGGFPRPAGGDRRRLPQGDAAVHGGQPGAGVTLSLHPDVLPATAPTRSWRSAGTSRGGSESPSPRTPGRCCTPRRPGYVPPQWIPAPL